MRREIQKELRTIGENLTAKELVSRKFTSEDAAMAIQSIETYVSGVILKERENDGRKYHSIDYGDIFVNLRHLVTDSQGCGSLERIMEKISTESVLKESK